MNRIFPESKLNTVLVYFTRTATVLCSILILKTFVEMIIIANELMQLAR